MCLWAHSSVVRKSNRRQKSICVLLHVTDIDYKTGNSDGGSSLLVSENIYTPSLYMINRQIHLILYPTYACIYIMYYICVYFYVYIFSVYIYICVYTYIYTYACVHVYRYINLSLHFYRFREQWNYILTQMISLQKYFVNFFVHQKSKKYTWSRQSAI